MSHRWSCPTEWEARREGERQAERGYGRHSNPYEGDAFGRDRCEDAADAWGRGYRNRQYEIEEQRAAEDRAERRREEERQEAAAAWRRAEEASYMEAQEAEWLAQQEAEQLEEQERERWEAERPIAAGDPTAHQTKAPSSTSAENTDGACAAASKAPNTVLVPNGDREG